MPLVHPPSPPRAPPYPPHNGSAASPPPPPPVPWPWRAGHPPPPTPPPATDADGNAIVTLPSDDHGSGPTPCVWLEGGCLYDSDCGGHGDCVRGVCECNSGYLGASMANPNPNPKPNPNPIPNPNPNPILTPTLTLTQACVAPRRL